ncbi:DUF6446 family protein [Pseudooceanicola sp.]|uniref:DUF6446 family protein n=1 Tax=Pseudooceanicola sp. TaxID=1914328 RepID=UPI0035C75342
MGRFLAALIVICALGAGGLLYYTQVYAFYDEVPATGEDVLLTRMDGRAELISYDSFAAIDAYSSPIRYRACFHTDLPDGEIAAAYQPYDGAEPLEAPGWFDCFNADEIGEALKRGEATAYLSVANITYGIDRIAAVFPDGRGYVWHQINPCGEVVFDGRPAPEGCPTPPE